MPDLLTAREAAERLRVADRTVYAWIERGTLPALKDRVTGRVYVPLWAVEALRPERRLVPVRAAADQVPPPLAAR